MSPIDDELRAALQRRADVLTPSPDPLAGIERRARRIQRNRIGAAVAGSALAVAAVAAVVPALQPTSAPQRDVPGYAASAAPTVQQTPAASYALDPEAPWRYRGDPALAVQGDVDAYTEQWATEHRVLVDDVVLTPLFGQVYEPSATPEVVYLVAQRSTGEHWWGVAQATESGPELIVDRQLTSPALSLAAALPGDEVARLLVVAAPEVAAIEYGEQGSEYRPMARLADGVATGPLDAPADSDLYRVLDRDGREVDSREAPDRPGTGTPPDGEPATALDPEQPWEVRGDPSLVTDGQLQALGEDWAQRHGVDPARVEVKPLYVQRDTSGGTVEVAYLVRFGENPWWWGVSALGEGGWWWYAENELRTGTEALAATLPREGSDDLMLVIAAPSTGGAFFAPPGDGQQPMEDLAPGVFAAVMPDGHSGVRYWVLDGDGDLDDPVAEGEVPPYQNAG